MATLKDSTLETLFELNDFRERAKSLRAQGLEALKSFKPKTAEETNNLCPDGSWISSESDVEIALLTKVQDHRDMGDSDAEASEGLQKRLQAIDLKILSPRDVGNDPTDPVPVLVAARAMHALVGRPSTVFCKATMLCYYKIIRELYTSHEPDWIVGAARAGKAGQASAFITGECVRAILAFEKSIRDTVRFFETTKTLYEEYHRVLELPDFVEGFDKAKDIEFERLGLDWYASNNLRRGVIAYDLSNEGAEPLFPLEGKITREFVDNKLKSLLGLLQVATKKAKENVAKAKNEIEKTREEEAGLLSVDEIIDIKSLAETLGKYLDPKKQDAEDINAGKLQEAGEEEITALIAMNLCKYISTFSPDTKTHIKDLIEGEDLAKGGKLKEELVKDINVLFKQKAILKIEQKNKLRKLDKEAEWLWERNKGLIELLEPSQPKEIGGDVLIRLNRRLLQAAFPTQIKQREAGYFERTFGAHSIAVKVVSDALREAEKAFAKCSEDNPDIPTLLHDLSGQFKNISHRVHNVINPAKRYIQNVLNRELALANNPAKLDPGELVFAAASFGAINDWKPNEQLTEARRILKNALPESGRFQTKRPFHSTPKGYRLLPIGCEMTRSFAQLLQKAREDDLDPKLVRNILNIFEEKPIFDRKDGTKIGWNFDNAPDAGKPSIWVTSISVLALDRVVRMLNERINAMILKHFNVEWPTKSGNKLGLNNLIYPDYELQLKYSEISIRDPHRVDNVSVAIRLQQMRAHITRAVLPNEYKETYSALFYGPTGTGKTTLAEALAFTSDIPLVRLSPSDLMVQGTDVIESRARAIFDSLSMLTQVVIMLDEFEPVVRNRDVTKRSPDITNNDPAEFRFLVTGMLPKLRKLNKAAKKQSFVYCLATNHLNEIDDAAKRTERFDVLIPIYHPDPISRAGVFLYRLMHVLEKDENWRDEYIALLQDAKKFKNRLSEVIQNTKGVSANSLATDFFNINKSLKNDSNSFFAYFIGLIADHPKTMVDYNLSMLKGETEVEQSIERKLQEFENFWVNVKL